MNRKTRRQAAKKLRRDSRHMSVEAKDAWENLMSLCGGDKEKAEQAISELMNKQLYEIKENKKQREQALKIPIVEEDPVDPEVGEVWIKE